MLAMGWFCIEKKWHFEWPGGSFAPFAIKPDGTIIWFVVREYVVYLQQRCDAHVAAYASAMAASARVKHASKGPPRQGDPEEPPPEGADPLPEPPVPPPDDADAVPDPPQPLPEGAGKEIELRRARRRRNLFEESRSIQHLLTHTPTNPYCRACMMGKLQRLGHRRGALKRSGGKPTGEGDLMTMNWIILKGSKGVDGECVLLLILDVGIF